MEKIKNSVRNSAQLQAVIVNAVIMILFLLIMHPYLENQADVVMQDLINGNYSLGVPSDSILFSSFMLGDLMTGLGKLAPALPWYMILHCACSFAALTIICGFVFRRTEGYEGKLLMTGVSIYMGYECYVVPGYLKTASVLSVAAVILLLSCMLRETSHRKACMMLAVITGVLASLTAFFLFAAVFALSAVLSLIYIVITKPYGDKKELLQSLAAGVAVAGCIYVLGAGLYYMDRLHYFRDPSLSASIAYRLGYEKCLSYGVPYFKFRDAEIEAANDAVYRLGALDTGLVDTNERLIYMAQARLYPNLYEIANFFAFEPEHIAHVPLLYLWGFLAYLFMRYGGKKGRAAVAVSAAAGILTLFFMRQFLILGYFRMYTLEIIPFVYFMMLWLNCIEYKPPAEAGDKRRMLMFAVDVSLAAYLAFVLFGDDFPVRKDMVHETEILYVEDDSTAQTDVEAENQQ